MGFDVIVVGARVGGASTGMLLARAGLRVLVVDRAGFPSDTLSTHQLQLPGVARLARWGLLERLLATGVPVTRRVRFQSGRAVVEGCYPEYEGVDAMVSPRRTVLDALLVDAAREAGAEVRERTSVQDLVRDDADPARVVGVRLQDRGTRVEHVERAAVVVAADGRGGRLAPLLGAAEYRRRPVQTAAFYSYWDGLPSDGGEMYSTGRNVVAAWPTHDRLVLTYSAWPVDQLDAIRRDPLAHLLSALDRAGSLGERARGARRVEPVRGTADLPNVFRRPFGPGLVLVGDAGLCMDPVTGLGMGHALRDAELASSAIVAGLDGVPWDRAMSDFARQRDHETLPSYDLTCKVAGLRPPTEAEQRLFEAVGADPASATRWLGTLAEALPLKDFFAPRHLRQLVGLRGMLALARSR